MSWPKTLADDEELVRERAQFQSQPGRDRIAAEEIEVRPTTTVEAPCCGRTCAADMVTDVRDVSGIDRDWLCDGCRWTFLKVEENGWDRPTFFRALGAPEEAVRDAWVQEQVSQAEKRAVEADELFKRHEARAAAEERLPETGMPSGTEPPSA